MNEQTKDQKPWTPQVGEKVFHPDTDELHGSRCVQPNVVYTVDELDNMDTMLVLRGMGGTRFGAYLFLPAEKFVSRDGREWLVVNKRVPDVEKDTWVSVLDHAVWFPGEWRKRHPEAGGPIITRKILVPWVEFPAPAATAQAPVAAPEKIEWSKIALTAHEAEQLFIIHRAGTVPDGGLNDGTLGASLKAKGLITRRHGNRPTIEGNKWVIAAKSGDVQDWCARAKKAEAALATCEGERDAAQTVLADREEEVARLRAKVAELEARNKPLTLARVAEFLRSQYPEAEMLQVHVVCDGISVAPTSKEALQTTIRAIKQMADGSREGT